MGEKYISPFDPIGQTKEKARKIARDADNLFKNIRFESDSVTFSHWIEMLVDYIENLQTETEKAKKTLAEFSKDTEIQYWKELYNTARLENINGFPISKEQGEEIEAWKEKHDIEVHNLNSVYERVRAGGTIGGRYFYKFVPTSIGVSGQCICGKCHQLALAESEGASDEYREQMEKLGGSYEFQELG